jgi:dethiobiotin synthetase
MSRGLFVTGTGTGTGKTTVAASLARALLAQGVDVAAIKPVETGVLGDDPADADELADACGEQALARDPAWFRATAALSPYAATLEGDPPLDVPVVVRRMREIIDRHRVTLVEGAGGLLVPLDPLRTIADLARAAALPLLIVAPDRLGVLSDVLTTVAAAERADLEIGGVVLCAARESDPSSRTNAAILADRLEAPVRRAPWCPDRSARLAIEADLLSLPALRDPIDAVSL